MVSKDTLVIAVTIFLSIYSIGFLLYLSFRQYLRHKEIELKIKMGMSPLREHLESKLSDLNERYLSSEASWKEANHLLLASQSNALDPTLPHRVPQNDEFLKLHGLTQQDLEIDERYVFVLTPFLPEFKPVFEQIKNICAALDLECRRGDEEFIQGEVFPHILKQIVKARLIIANITGRNPNVFYELGIAHALDKPVILVARHTESIPFDLKTKYIVVFSDEPDLNLKLKDVLLRLFVSGKASK